MFTPDNYQLLDFGDGRKLEQFGPYILDRRSPAAAGVRRRAGHLWPSAASRYDRTQGDTGVWTPPGSLPPSWSIVHGATRIELKPNRFGHLGIFPEQAENWDWIDRQVRGQAVGLKVLNLFAYTGAASLAAAAAGASVVHLDAARTTVQRARRNAELSGFAQAPIRWIVEDARKFVRRELKRGNRYDAVILDPPSYGHGTHGDTWSISQHLPSLLSMCGELTRSRCAFVLLTAHSPGLGPADLKEMLVQAGFPQVGRAADARPMVLRTSDGRSLLSGNVVRWPA